MVQYLGMEFGIPVVMQIWKLDLIYPSLVEHDHSDTKGLAIKRIAWRWAFANHSDGLTEQASDLSGYQQVIEQFGHTHGEFDIGFIKTSEGQINPKVYKRALAEMWQASLALAAIIALCSR